MRRHWDRLGREQRRTRCDTTNDGCDGYSAMCQNAIHLLTKPTSHCNTNNKSNAIGKCASIKTNSTMLSSVGQLAGKEIKKRFGCHGRKIGSGESHSVGVGSNFIVTSTGTNWWMTIPSNFSIGVPNLLFLQPFERNVKKLRQCQCQ